MTFLPLESRDVVGTSGPRYDIPEQCCHPFCSRKGVDIHHLWRRSFLGGAFNWVKLPDGKIVGNVVRLCVDHHKEITENKSRIGWVDGFGIFSWVGDCGNGYMGGPLDPMPPLSVTDSEPRPRVGNAEEDDVGWEEGFMTLSDAGESLTEPHSHTLEPGTECPTCHRKVPPEKEKLEKTRVRATWSIRIPKDSQEDGAEILDSLLEECRLIIGRPDDEKVKYFVLVESLALVTQHGHKMSGDE